MGNSFDNGVFPVFDIEYKRESGLLQAGSFDSVPQAAYGAEIFQTIPFVDFNREL